MKSQSYKRLVFIAMLISLVFVATDVAAKKPVKPPPEPDKTTGECIVFWGDLEGGAIVEDCCPNAGPWPAYEMILSLPNEDDPSFRYIYNGPGQLFMSGIRTKEVQGYKVQFWSWDWGEQTPGDGDIFFEIYGGDVITDKKNKTLMVSFEDVLPTLWSYDHWVAGEGCCADVEPIGPVSFDLLRTSDLSYCQ